MQSSFRKLVESKARRALVASTTLRASERDESPVSRQGGIPLGFSDEEWPKFDGVPLFPILSVFAPELPFVPRFLEGFDYWSFFIVRDDFEQVVDDGSMVVRRYETTAGLVPLQAPEDQDSRLIELTFAEVRDYPSDFAFDEVIQHDNQIARIAGNGWEEELKSYPCHDGIKLGGYPRLIQGTAFLLSLDPDYEIQIDMTELYTYGDSGIGYVFGGLSAAIWETF